MSVIEKYLFCCMCVVLLALFEASCATVHVLQKTFAGSTETLLLDETVEAGVAHVSQKAPVISGYIFTHWSISEGNVITVRDVFGRANDEVEYVPYEETILTANYMPASMDTDEDGVPDGTELYWYGNLNQNADSDTDGDGFSFLAELNAGTSPLMYDITVLGGVLVGRSIRTLYNPMNLSPYVIKCEPEGALFTTITNYVNIGENVSLPIFDYRCTSFAYWTTNGVRCADCVGRAIDSIQFAMPPEIVECVAVCTNDVFVKEQLYWYGSYDVSGDSDTDGDGFTFAQEIEAGTNPLFFDYTLKGGILNGQTPLTVYNANMQSPYIVRCEPENALFATTTNYVRIGTSVTLDPMDHGETVFAYWNIDGVRQQDIWGRAVDAPSFVMPNRIVECVAVCETNLTTRNLLYWCGSDSVSLETDADGDGFTLAQEIAAGTNPYFYDYSLEGGILKTMSRQTELDLQRYEQVQGAVVGGAYSQMFTSPVAGNAATSATFGNGGAIWPVVADLNGDGLWDLIVVSVGATNVFVNVGGKGNPEFEVDASGALGERALPWNATNSTEKLAGLSLDVTAPQDALSATYGDANQDGVEDLLVSDGEGRIWYYRGERPAQDGASPSAFTLQHKVWGGSFAGFAQGLRLAAVDWEDDGDLDCLAGTADGKLMLLRDPKVGRPTNLKALAGVDNVLLTWDPNAQSRIRGYRVYRGNGELGTGNGEFARIAQTPLPTYRDFPETGGAFDYKVSSVSRFYTAGNSTPTETESMPTEAIRAELGNVRFFWNDVSVKLGDQAAVMLSIENSMNYNVTGKTQTVSFDPAYLTPVRVERSGLTEDVSLSWSSADGLMTISMTGGSLAAGSGKFLTLVFDTVKAGTTKVGGANGATVSIEDLIIVPYQLGDIDGDGDVDKDDLQLLARLKNGNGQHPTANQIKAGDFNGNGKLDNADFQALKALLKERGL